MDKNIDIKELSLEDLQALGFGEYNKREAARKAIENIERNITLINQEIARRESEKKDANA